MHVLSVVLLITMALAKGMALRGLAATITARLASRLSAGTIPSMARQYGSSKKAYPSSSSRMTDRSESRPIPQPKATIIKPKTTPTEPQLAPASGTPLTESRPSPEKSRKGPEILETFPDALLPKDFASWSGTETDFQRLIILEDDAILVVFKPAGVMAQPDDDEKAAGAADAGFGSSSKPSESASRVVVRNNRYFYPDIDILTLATKYLEREAEKAAANQPKPKPRSKYLDGFDEDDFSRKQKSVFVGLVHRLDRPASGLMILAKTPEALKNLNKQFADQVVIKRYVCMVNGKIDKPDVCIDYLLKTSGDVAKVVRNPFRIKSGGSSNSSSSSSSSSSSDSTTDSETILSIDDILEGRVNKGTSANTAVPTEGTTAISNDPRLRSDVVRAELSYTPLHVIEHTVRKKWDNIMEAKNARPRHPKRPTSSSSSSPAANVAPETEEVVKVMADGYVETKTYQTLLNVTLLTGRKHQIRTQLSHRQHPIVGDQKYLAPQAFGERDISLHAYYLGFFHPTTRARVALRLDVPRIWEKRFGRDTWKQIVPLVAKPVHTKASKAAAEAAETATTATAADAVGTHQSSAATVETAAATATPVASAASTTVV